ncbi:MAG: helix-turn-helix domain-containing protein, partial [Fuerstiella sp.]
MKKKYIVRLSKKERETLPGVSKRLTGSSQKVRRAQILLKADVRGQNWTDARIAEAFSCRVQTVENLRKRFVMEGFEIALNGKTRESPPREKRLDGK